MNAGIISAVVVVNAVTLLAVVALSFSHFSGGHSSHEVEDTRTELLEARTSMAAVPTTRFVDKHEGEKLGNFEYIDNGQIRVGIDLERGGAIGYLAPSGPPSDAHNVINIHDLGRWVQMSFYAGPTFYNPPTAAYPNGACDKLFHNKEWPWNPVGAGDLEHNAGEVLYHKKNESTIHVITRPMQWACFNVKCECTFEQVIRLDESHGGIGVHVTATLHSDRTDPFTPITKTQELPAVYSNGDYYHLVTYSGSNPFTNEATTEYKTGFGVNPMYPTRGRFWLPGRFQATENWAALVDNKQFGMGVVNTEVTDFIGGFAGGKPGAAGPKGPHDTPTGYLSPVKSVKLGPKDTFVYDFHLVLGDLKRIRDYAYEVKNASSSSSPSTPPPPLAPAHQVLQ